MPFRVVGYNKEIDSTSLAGMRQSVLDLTQWVTYEFQQIASALVSTEADKVWNTPPPKPRQGTQAYADGTHWNPGAGEGFYEYTSTGWVPMFTSAGATVTSIAGNTGAFTLSHGITNSVNDLQLDVGVFRSYLAGLTLSTAGASTTFSVAAGVAVNSTNVDFMKLAAALSKTTAAWAVGGAVGGLDTGAIANSTWYHAYLIKRPDTGVVDVCVSLSASAPTTGTNIPAAYTLFRRIGSMLTNASGQWTAFTQLGNEFLWVTPVSDVQAANPGIVAILYALTVPAGIQVQAITDMMGYNGAGSIAYYLVTSPDEADVTPAQTAMTFACVGSAFLGSSGRIQIRTNTSRQIRYRASASIASTNFWILTHGWIDTRGRDL